MRHLSVLRVCVTQPLTQQTRLFDVQEINTSLSHTLPSSAINVVWTQWQLSCSSERGALGTLLCETLECLVCMCDSAVDSTDNDCLMSKRSTLRCCTPCLLCGLNGSSPAIFQAMIMFISIMMACPATMPASMLWSVRLCNIFTSRALSYQFLACKCNQPSSCHRFDTHSLPTALLLITPVFNIFMYGTHFW